MSKQRKFVLIAAAVGIISMFLPWVQVSVLGHSKIVNGFHGNGILVLFCFAASGIITFLGNKIKTLDKTKWMITLISGTIATLVVMWDIINAGVSVHGSPLGSGIYMAALAAIGVLLSAFLFRSSTDRIKDSFETLKQGINNITKNTASINNTGLAEEHDRHKAGSRSVNPGNTTNMSN